MIKLKTKFAIFFFIACIFIGIGLALQIKISDGQRLYVSAKSIDDYKVAIKGEKKEYEKLKGILYDTRKKIELYEKTQAGHTKQERIIKEKFADEVESFKLASGAQKIFGPGVEVTIDDATRELLEGEDINNLLVHDTDILMIINELNRCGAEAISVNGQRITPRTAVVCSGYTVRINGEVYARPFKIKAIGDPNRMAAALVAKEGYGAALKEWGVQFEVKISDEIVIEPIGAEALNIYMKKVKGEEKN